MPPFHRADGNHSARLPVPAFLASVTCVAEARLALDAGADLIDCKDPKAGALGALPPATIKNIVAVVAGAKPVSATIGDLPTEPPAMVAAAEAIAATGVDIVKVGFFGSCDARPAIAALGQARLAQARLVAVLMADRRPDLNVIPDLAGAGFYGVMLDTADKAAGPLTTVASMAFLAEFLGLSRDSGLIAGLAGSLQRRDIATLIPLRPDILGFRGALCRDGRTSVLDAARTAAIRNDIWLAAGACSEPVG